MEIASIPVNLIINFINKPSWNITPKNVEKIANITSLEPTILLKNGILSNKKLTAKSNNNVSVVNFGKKIL